MEEFNYRELEFKSGLEIHQQLNTHKLFCNCPSVLRSDEPDFIVKRKLHAVAGETGGIDTAAAYEKTLNRDFIYQGYDTTCLVELDEEPPHEINQEALKIALQISLLLNCKILPITQVMRKTVIDGSNTSGFQRTLILAKDGFVKTKQGKVGIESICLEEDAARIIEKKEKQVFYRLDRLGIPLVEIATSPDIKSPEQAKEVALHIGDILRSCKVKRGIGTIRQDVNVSIQGKNRIEIKGVQNPDLIVKTLNSEIKRQLELLEKEKEIKSEVRKALADGETKFMRPMPGADRMYPETDLPLLKIHKKIIDECKKSLPKLRSEIEKDLVKTGLNHELIKLLFKRDMITDFNELVKIYNQPDLVAKMILIFPNEIASHFNLDSEDVYKKIEDYFVQILNSLKDEKIMQEQIKEVMERLVKGDSFEKAIKFEKQDMNNVEETIMKIVKEKPGLNLNAYMGLAMKEFKGKVSGKKIMEILKKYIN